MVTSLIKHERIKTTTARAKELRRVAERCVTYAKKNTNTSKVLASKIVYERPMVTKLFEILGPRYRFREGGYTRVMKLATPRRGDSSDMAVVEFVDRPGELRRSKPPSGWRKQLLFDPDFNPFNIPPLQQKNSSDSSLEEIH